MVRSIAIVIAVLGGRVQAADLFQRVCTGSLGMVSIPVYVQGKCIFQCVTPDGWQADPQPSAGAAVVFTSPTNLAAAISITVTPVSLAERELQPWRIPRLRASVRTPGTFVIADESPTVLDESPGIQMRGVRRLAGQSREEFHSFHIRHGYLISISAHAPQLDQILPAVRIIAMTFRSFEQLPSGAHPVTERSIR